MTLFSDSKAPLKCAGTPPLERRPSPAQQNRDRGDEHQFSNLLRRQEGRRGVSHRAFDSCSSRIIIITIKNKSSDIFLPESSISFRYFFPSFWSFGLIFKT